MNQEEKKEAVLDWIQSGCNYDEGVNLYTQLGKNNFLRKDFPDKQNKYATKIIYELCKSVGLNYHQLKSEDFIPKVEMKLPELITIAQPELEGEIIPSIENREEKELPENLQAENISEYPAILRRIISEYAETFQERSKTHRIMTEMPEGNSQSLKTRRAELFILVKELTVKLEKFYSFRKRYEESGFVPTEEEVWPTPKEPVKAELPDDPEILRKMKKNQQSANTKDQNMLDYQSEKRAEKEKPMPAGPKRMKLENRIKARLAMIEQIEIKLLESPSLPAAGG